MPRKITKSAVATGVSLGRETYDRVIAYHRRIEDFFLKSEGRRPSLSDTIELMIRTGLEVAHELDFDDVIQAMRERKVPEEVGRIARKRRATVLGGLTDAEVDELLEKAGRTRK